MENVECILLILPKPYWDLLLRKNSSLKTSVKKKTEIFWGAIEIWQQRKPVVHRDARTCCNSEIVNNFFSKSYPKFSIVIATQPESEHFLNSIRHYNGCFKMTSFGTHIIREEGFMQNSKVAGWSQAELCYENFPGTRTLLIQALRDMLNAEIPYIKDFKTAIDVPEFALVTVGQQQFEKEHCRLKSRKHTTSYKWTSSVL